MDTMQERKYCLCLIADSEGTLIRLLCRTGIAFFGIFRLIPTAATQSTTTSQGDNLAETLGIGKQIVEGWWVSLTSF